MRETKRPSYKNTRQEPKTAQIRRAPYDNVIVESPNMTRTPTVAETPGPLLKEQKLDLLRKEMEKRLDKIQQARSGPTGLEFYTRSVTRLVLSSIFILVSADNTCMLLLLHEYAGPHVSGVHKELSRFEYDSSVWVGAAWSARLVGLAFSTVFVLPDLLRDHITGRKIMLASVLSTAATAYLSVLLLSLGHSASFCVMFAVVPSILSGTILVMQLLSSSSCS